MLLSHNHSADTGNRPNDTDPIALLQQKLSASAKTIRVIDGRAPQPVPGEDGSVLSRLVDEEAFKNAKGYVFTGQPDLQSTFLLYYLIDAAQSGLPAAFINSEERIPGDAKKSLLKPIVICNYGPAKDPHPAKAFIERAQQLQDNKFLKCNFNDIVHVVNHPDEVPAALNSPKPHTVFKSPSLPDDLEYPQTPARDESKPSIFLCCSFSTQNEFYVELAKQLGQQITENGYNLVTGGGRYPGGKAEHGMMYNAQKSAYDAKDAARKTNGDVTGVTFAPLNPLTEHSGHGAPHYGLTRIVATKNLAERVEVMTDLSDAVVIAPGGFGTDSESMGPLLMRQVASALIEKKPMVIINAHDPEDPKGEGVHTKLIALLESLNLHEDEHFHVVDSPTGISGHDELAAETAKLVIAKLADPELNVHSHARKLDLSKSAVSGTLPPGP